jgi:cytochrome c551
MKYWGCFFMLILMASCAVGPSGESLYNGQCSSCHGKEGEGLGQLIPPIADSDFIKDNRGLLSCIIVYGVEGPMMVNGVVYDGNMPGMPKLTKVEVANIINYIHEKWYKDKPLKTVPEVAKELESCE